MPEFDPMLIVIIAVVLLCSFLAAAAYLAHQQRELRSFVRKWDGKLVLGGFFGSPQVTFPLGGVTARLHYSHQGEDDTLTHLDIPLTNFQVCLELWHRGAVDRSTMLTGRQSLETGSAEFDALFTLQVNDPEVRELLTPSLQAAVLSLAKWQNMHNPDLHLLLSNGNLRITKHRPLFQEMELSRFVQFCSDIQRCLEPAGRPPPEARAGVER